MIMVSHHVSMVGGEADDGIVVHILFFQASDNFTDLIIDKGDVGIIVSE